MKYPPAGELPEETEVEVNDTIVTVSTLKDALHDKYSYWPDDFSYEEITDKIDE